MKGFLDPEQRRELARRGFSRRDFGRLAALFTAGAALPFYNEAALAQGLSFFPMLHDEKINFALKFYPKLRKATIVIVESQLRFILGDNRSAEHVLIVTVPTDSQYSSHLTFAFGDGLQELIFLFERLPAN